MSGVLALMQWLEHYIILLMMAVFIGIVAFTYWPGRRGSFERQGQIPFKDDV